MNQVAELLLEIEAVFLSPKDLFTWASGIKSPIYCDNRLVLSNVKARTIIEKAIGDKVKETFSECDAVVGTATAGIGHAAIVAHLLELPNAYVRASSKDHGRQNKIEGKLLEGQKVVVIEDLISTGSSSIEVVKTLQALGIEVLGVVSIFTYGLKKAQDNFASVGVDYYSLANIEDLLAVATAKNYISASDTNIIEDFIKSLDA